MGDPLDERGTGDRGTSTAPFQNTGSPPQSLATIVPDAAPARLYAGCRIPENTVLAQPQGSTVTTQQDRPSKASIRTDGKTIDLSFDPELLVKTPWPASNVTFAGLTYTFSSGAVTAIRSASSWDVFDANTDVRSAVSEWFHGIVDGTRVAEYGYDPFADTDLRGTLQSLNLGSGDTLGGVLDSCVIGAYFTLRKNVDESKDDVGVRLGSGSKVNVQVELDGVLEQLLDGNVKITTASIGVDPGSALITYRGASVAGLKGIAVHYGGRVDVSYQPLGIVQTATGAAALTDFLAKGAYFMVALGSGELGKASDVASAPNVISGALAATINAVFTDAIDGLIKAYRDAIPGVNLAAMLGFPDYTFAAETVTGSANRIVFDPIEFSVGSNGG